MAEQPGENTNQRAKLVTYMYRSFVANILLKIALELKLNYFGISCLKVISAHFIHTCSKQNISLNT